MRISIASFLAAALATAAPLCLTSQGAPATSTRPPLASVAIDAATRRAIVDSVAHVLEARYVDAQVARLLAAAIRARRDSGVYDTIREPAAFGAALMRDLQRVAADRHLRISYEPEREYALGGPPSAGAARVMPPAAPGGAIAWRRIDPRDSATIARTNFAFRKVERLPGNIGYLQLDQFVPLDLSRDAAVAAMAVLAGSDAVIIDLRDNVGGSPDLVDLLASYFLPPEPVVLLQTYSRALDQTSERRSLREVPGRRLTNAALYIVVNGNSASAAEMLPYMLQRLGRATIVGERTAGAGNGGAKLSVGAGLALFVPQMRIVSGPGYEKTGVEPDVSAPSDSALAVARRLALSALASRTASPEIARERAWALELLRAESRAMPSRATLQALTGRFGTSLVRTVRLDGDRLVTIGSTGWSDRVLPVDDSTFRSADARYRFERDAAGRVTALVRETIDGRVTRLPRLAGDEDDVSRLGDEFDGRSTLANWRQFHEVEGWPNMTKRLELRDAAGELYLEPQTSGWYADFHAPFVFREVTGDFVVTTRLRADGLTGSLPRAPWSLAGLMVRAPRAATPATWTPGGEDWLFITTGVAEDVATPVLETKSTRHSQSRLRLHPARAGWVELRITRRGSAFELASRWDGEEWVVRERFEREDLPATLQVGLNAYTDWYSTTALQADPLRFNTTVVTNGKPDLGVRVDWIRFARR